MMMILQQTSEPNFPDIVRIAISKQGITIIHPKTKVSVIDNSLCYCLNVWFCQLWEE